MCKDGEKNTEKSERVIFCFLDRSNLIKTEIQSEDSRRAESLIKKVTNISYKEEGVGKDRKAYLLLRLGGSNSDSRKLEVNVKSVWKSFKNTDPSEKCSLETMVLGEDSLKCELTLSSEFGGKPFYYLFQLT